MRPRHGFAWAFAALMATAAAYLLWRLPASPVETSVLALLPGERRAPEEVLALERLGGEAERRLLFLVGHADAARAASLADAFAAALRRAPELAQVVDRAPQGALEALAAFYGPRRAGLLSPQDRTQLASGSTDLARRALDELLAPAGAPRLLSLEQDPLGLFQRWAMAGQGGLALQERDGRLALDAEGLSYYAVLATAPPAGLPVAQQLKLASQVAAARAVVLAEPGAQLLRSGFLLHAAEAARQAQWEISVIGSGSTLGILAVVFWAFRSLSPALLVLLPVAMGCLAGSAAALLCFPKVHVITLVFGSTIIGIAEDYGTHFLSGVFAPGRWSPEAWLQGIRKGLALALATSLLGYAVMLALPFPGIRQMGVFSMAGLAAAWATSVLWLPLLSRGLKPGPASVQRFSEALQRAWPRWDLSRPLRVLIVVGTAGAALAASRAGADDDVRQLYAAEPGLAAEQKRIEALLRLPATGQFILVKGRDAQRVLEAEEGLFTTLEPLREQGLYSSAQGVSRWVPSRLRQRADQETLKAAYADPRGPLADLAGALGEPGMAARARAALAASAAPLELEDWLASPLSAPWRSLWLDGIGDGMASAVTLAGVRDAAAAGALKEAAAGAGAVFVDRVAGISSTVARYRRGLGLALAGGIVLVAALLARAYGRRAWRAMAPMLLGGLLSVAALSVLGLPLNLFALLALVLLLGMGVDFGIYVQESGSGGHAGAALMAILLSASTTVLAFGLLGLSSTPALRVFGVTLSAGLLGAWLLAPCFAPTPREGG